MLKLERFAAVCTLEPAQQGGLVVADHVPLQPVNVRKVLLADGALLKQV